MDTKEYTTKMIYLLLAVLSSSLISVVMRAVEDRCRNKMGMFVVNYFTCMTFSCLFAGRIAVYTPQPGFGQAVLLGCIAGVLFLVCFVLLQLNIQKNGVAMASTFMKLGVVISTLIAIIIFHETPKMTQGLGMVLAIVSILIIHYDGNEKKKASWKWLLPVLLVCGGITDSMANVFDKVGDPALKDYYLFYVFTAAFLCALLMMLFRHEKIGRWEIISGILVGIPNYFSTRFLLLSLSSLPAVIVYPVVSAGTIILVSVAGVFLFQEKLSRRKLIALGIICLALVLLNI